MYENVAYPELILRKPASFIVHHKDGQDGAAAQFHNFFFGLNCGTALFWLELRNMFRRPEQKGPKTELFFFLKEKAWIGIFDLPPPLLTLF